MKLKILARKGYEEAVRILAVSFGFVSVSILWAIGIGLILKEIYLGLVPLIIGYEIVRVLIKFIWKYVYIDMEIKQ